MIPTKQTGGAYMPRDDMYELTPEQTKQAMRNFMLTLGSDLRGEITVNFMRDGNGKAFAIVINREIL
jgi:hypothetical protein